MNWKKSRHAGKDRNNDDHVNLIIIPGKIASPINIGLPLKYVKWLGAITACFILAVLVLGWAYISSQGEIRAVRVLQENSRQQQEEIEQLTRQISDFEASKAEIEQKQDAIKQMMGLKPLTESRSETTSRSGQGGMERSLEPGEPSEMLDPRGATTVDARLSDLEQELQELGARVQREVDYFRALPNQWPAEGSISSGFGWRNSPFGGSRQAFHDGIDIANHPGTEILAAADGRVIYSGWMSVYGRTILIEHGYGLTTKYGHNSRLLVEEGQQVRKGEEIAYMGTTGLSTGPHLHFTVYKHGTPIDPLIYLP